MNESFWIGSAILIVSGMLNASFPLPMKYTRAWKWENIWLAFTTLGLLVFPVLLALATVPNLGQLYASVPFSALVPAIVFGFLWGTAQVTFGLSIALIGMAMGFAIVVGMCGLLGSFISLAVLNPGDLMGPKGLVLAISAVILAVGLTIYARAGRQREKDAGLAVAAGTATFRKGLIVAIYTGATGGALNLGFAFSGDLAKRAVEQGAGPLSKDLAVWALVLAAGYVPNLVYCGYLLVRNRTAGHFGIKPVRETGIAIMTALLWLSGTLGYGSGATTMGAYGTSIGYAIYVTMLLLWSTTLGVLTGEWKQAKPQTVRQMRLGVVIILLSLFVLVSAG